MLSGYRVKPPVQLRLNRAARSAVGLKACYVPAGDRYYDYVALKYPTVISGSATAPAATSTAVGRASNYTGVAANRIEVTGAGINTNIITVTAVASWNAAGLGDDRFVFLVYNSDGDSISLWRNGFTNGFSYGAFGSSVDYGSATSATPIPVSVTFTLTSPGNGNVALWVNGAKVSTGTTTYAGAASPATLRIAGQDGRDNISHYGSIAMVMVHWGIPDIPYLHADPFRVFRPVRERFAFSVPAGGTRFTKLAGRGGLAGTAGFMTGPGGLAG